MKKINLILGALVCLFAFSACTEEVQYNPASPESAKGVYFPSTLPAQMNLDANADAFDVQICRTDSVGEQVVELKATTSDTTGIFTFPETVTFADGAKTAVLSISYDKTKMAYDEFIDITLAVDENEASAYGFSSYSFVAGILGPWESLGYATFTDSFFFVDSYKVEVQQNKLNPLQFRLVKPYHEAFEVDDNGSWGGPWEGTDEYMTFTLLQPGETLGDAQITQKDLVYFAPFCTGWNNPTYKDIVNVYHPVTFTKYQDEKYFTYNKVVSYQENGLPAVVQLAPYYYMDNTGGWDNTQKDGMITITFPGVVISDYSINIEYLGKFIDPKDNVFADFSVSMGADVANAKVGLALSEDVNGVLAGILNGSIESVEMTEAGTTRFAIKDPGKYTAIAISYNADGEPQEAVYTQFEYSAAGAPAWKSLGLAQYTDDYIASLFKDVEPVTYNVEIQENEETPGLYRLVNPYGAAYPYNQEGDWNTSSDFYLEINAIDPQGVYIETQALGFDWGYGEFIASSQTAQLLADNDLETIKAAGGFCGTLVDGVITFPTKALLVSAESLDGWYYANSNGAFKVVLPSASKSSKSVKAITNRVKADKKNIGGQRLKKMDRQFPTVANKK